MNPVKMKRGNALGSCLWLALASIFCSSFYLQTLRGQSSKKQAPPIPVRFTDIRESAGITFLQDSTQTEEKLYLETMGTGVAWLDYDQDGLMDLYFVQSGPTELYKPAHPLRSALYHNNGDGTFTDVTLKSGVGGEGHYGQGVAVGDYDNDGYPDLYVTGYQRAILYHNNGDGTFTDVTAKAGVADEGGWSTSAAWMDYDKDGYLDLVVTNYIEWSPKNYKGQKIKLYHNNHDGTFTDVSDSSGVGKPEAKGMGVVVADFNNDGWPDIAVANDSWPNFLFINKHDGTFQDVSFLSGIAASEDGRYEAGMGIDAADWQNRGRPGLLVGNFSGEALSLFAPGGSEGLADVTYAQGMGEPSLQFLTFGLFFFDYDLDGWKDAFIGNGHIDDTVRNVSDNKLVKVGAPA